MKRWFWIWFVLLAGIVTALGFYRVSDNKVKEQNLIAELQIRQSPGSIHVLQFVSDSISFFSLGIPALALVSGFFLKRKHWVRHALIILLGIGLGGLISATVKRTLKEPRPYEVDRRIAQLSVGGSNSFPSGHTVEAVAAAVGFSAILFRTPISIVLSAAWALAIMYSRVVLGVHSLTDIMAGAAVGCLGLLTIHRLFQRYPLKES